MSDLLSYEGFKHVLESQMGEAFAKHGEVVQVTSQKVLKDNDREMDAILIGQEGQDVKGCYYAEQLYATYERGESIETILENMLAQVLPVLKQKVDGSEIGELLRDWENVRPLIGCRLINAEANRQRLNKQIYKQIGEFAISYYVRSGVPGQGNEFYAMPVQEFMYTDWGVSLDELHETALQNMDLVHNFTLKSIKEMYHIKGPAPSLFALSIKERIHGATVMISEEVLEAVKKLLRGDFYIVPVSIHELLVLKKSESAEARYLQLQLNEMNRAYNDADQEYLSNHIYEYNSAKKELLRAV